MIIVQMRCDFMIGLNSDEGMNCTVLYIKTQDKRCGLFLNELSDELNEVNLEKGIGKNIKHIGTIIAKHTEAMVTDVYKVKNCQYSSQISCGSPNSNCYNIIDICVYRLNMYHQLVPCAFGENLQDCRQFECNMMFKCPNFYCIPWTYVCDGMWDCPYGYDESPIKIAVNTEIVLHSLNVEVHKFVFILVMSVMGIRTAYKGMMSYFVKFIMLCVFPCANV